jgi:predicted DNA-binding transcriptional regulator AlpA
MSAITTENRDPLIRLSTILGRKEVRNTKNKVIKEAIEPLIPVCKATWYAGIAKGDYPAPIKLSPRVSMWRLSEVLDVINRNRAPNE